MSTSEHVTVEIQGAVQIIRLDRPAAMNAINGEMFEAMSDALVLGEGDGKIRAFVLTGSPGVFSEGSDRSELAEYIDTGAITASSIRFLKTIATLDKPLVAAVDGPAFGIATTMLFLCDYVVASEWAVFTADQVGLGLPLDAASTLLGPRMLGHHHAFELLVVGEPMDALRAMGCGLVNRVVSADAVEETALRAAALVASRPPEAVRLAKRMMVGDRRDVVTRITNEAQSFAALQNSPHASAALRERIDRRG